MKTLFSVLNAPAPLWVVLVLMVQVTRQAYISLRSWQHHLKHHAYPELIVPTELSEEDCTYIARKNAEYADYIQRVARVDPNMVDLRGIPKQRPDTIRQ